MRAANGYSGALYNKPLLRLIEFVLFITLGFTGYIYLTQSAAKLGMQGFLDALAVFSFIIAAYLLMLVAEVADAHYLRALGALGLLVGCGVGANFIFVLDAPHLETGPMGLALLAFIFAIVMDFVYLALIIGRLFHGKTTAAQVAKVADERGIAPSRPVAEAMKKAVDVLKAEPAPMPAAAAELSLVGIAGPYLGQRFALRKGENTIGRADGDIVLGDDKQVSRKHCTVVWADDGLVIRDLGSTNGIFVNGQKVAESTVGPGDMLAIGGSTFKVS
jgi:hypothetical protein